MADAKDIVKMLKDDDVKFVDLRFTDVRGKWQHVTMDAGIMDADSFDEGIMFDGSSIAGWKAINDSDMTLAPDLDTAVLDPFTAQKTLIITCDIHEPLTGEDYARDPRSTAKRAEAYLNYTGTGDTAYFGPEPEFFIFEDVRFDDAQNNTFYAIDDIEGVFNSGREYEGGNYGHRPKAKGGYFPVPPVDSSQDIRSEMLSTMTEMGITVEKHHHEVAPSQQEVGILFDTMVSQADKVQILKYCVHNVAHAYGKTATFMPKPLSGDNGTGMHVHQSIWKDGNPVFAGSGYADLSDEALFYIGGIIKHARAINAFANSTTNSYKRLIPGFEAPVLLAYSARNRSAACRIPYSNSPKGKRVEVRFPDSAGNPYLTFASMLMAGLDGIENKIDPGEAMDKDLYSLAPEELLDVPQVCGSLRDALDALAGDNAFLTKGDVFSQDQVDAYIELKWEEVYRLEHAPHPVEFDMYYSA